MPNSCILGAPKALGSIARTDNMLKKLKKYFDKKVNAPYTRVPASQHNIDNSRISSAAHKVIDKLQSCNFQAYLVGGGVRDLLLGGKPKDFDVATDATPEEINGLFRNARMIGNRFRIVHVRFGREVIEVTTFRGSHHDAANKGEAHQNKDGILVRDNVYGDIISDAARRDFSVNALYYNPTNTELLNFGSGLDDLNQRTIRIIGQAEKRYKEDPVRLLRAMRFAAKLGFSIEKNSAAPIKEHGEYLAQVPPARRFEEVLKLFTHGSATATLSLLRDYNLLQYLFPSLEQCLKRGNETDNNLVIQAAANTDTRIRQRKRITPAFIYAAFLWPALRAEMRELVETQKLNIHEALQRASQGIVAQQVSTTSIPKRFLIPMREIWALQLRMPFRDKQRAYKTLEHARFRAAYDFLLLREQAGEDLGGLGMWWTQFQHGKEEEQIALLAEANKDGSQARKRRRKKRQPKTP